MKKKRKNEPSKWELELVLSLAIAFANCTIKEIVEEFGLDVEDEEDEEDGEEVER